jgi:hypothetical protein
MVLRFACSAVVARNAHILPSKKHWRKREKTYSLVKHRDKEKGNEKNSSYSLF